MREDPQGERRGRDILGMPVYSVEEGRHLGQVTTLLVRWGDATVAAVGIGSSLSSGPAVPFANLRLVGEDAVLVESAGVLTRALSPEAERGLDAGVLGRPVITASGEKIGNVTGFRIATDDGRITAYRMRPAANPLARLVHLLRHDSFEVLAEAVQALGADALILLEEAIPELEDAPATGGAS